jgi:hypothetical protein
MFFDYGLRANKTGGMDKGLVALKNAYGLKSIMNRYISRISMQDFAEQKIIDLPEAKVNEHYLDQSEEGDLVFEELANRMAEAKASKEKQNEIAGIFSNGMAEAKASKEKQNEIAGIFSNGITASVDPRMYQRMQIRDLLDPTPQNNRVKKVIDLVLKRRAEDTKAGQIIFLDNAGHTASKTSTLKIDNTRSVDLAPTLEKNLHVDMKEQLIASGKYKPNEVAIINGQEITDPKTGKEVKASGNKAQQLKQDIAQELL